MRLADRFSLMRRWARPQHVVIALSTLLVLAYGTSTYLTLQRSHHQTVLDAVATLESMNRSIEIGANRAIFEGPTRRCFPASRRCCPR